MESDSLAEVNTWLHQYIGPLVADLESDLILAFYTDDINVGTDFHTTLELFPSNEQPSVQAPFTFFAIVCIDWLFIVSTVVPFLRGYGP